VHAYDVFWRDEAIMRNRAIFLAFLALAAAALALAACGSSGGTADLQDAALARGYNSGTAVDPTTVFAATDKIHLILKVGNTADGAKIKAVWSLVAATGYEPRVLDESLLTLKRGENVGHFILTNDQPWPVGSYRVAIYMHDKLSRTLEYQVAQAEVKTPTIESAILAKGYENVDPVDPTNVFAPDDITIHLVAKVGNAVEGTNLRAIWYVAEVQGYEPQTIDEATYTLVAGENIDDFTLTNDKPWPAGKYKVELYLDGRLAQTLEYEVQ